MSKFKCLIIYIIAFVFSTNARPTIDLLYKIAENIEQELIGDSQTPSRDPYQIRNTGYGYPHSPILYSGGTQSTYPGQYTAEFYPNPAANHLVPPYSGPYQQYGPAPQYIPYPPPNNYAYIQGHPNSFDYIARQGNNGYGHASGSNSYVYGSKSGYKNVGY